MPVFYSILNLKKRHPLTISRGTITGTKSLFLRFEAGAKHGDTWGMGEICPGTIGGIDDVADAIPLLQAWLDLCRE